MNGRNTRRVKEHNDMGKMVEEFSARVGQMVVAAHKLSDTNTGLREKLNHLIREFDTLSSEEKREKENLRTAERRLKGIQDREQDLKMLFGRIERAETACINPDS